MEKRCQGKKTSADGQGKRLLNVNFASKVAGGVAIS